MNWKQRTSDYSWIAIDDDRTQYVVSRTYNKEATTQWVCAWIMPEGEICIATAAWETAEEAMQYVEGFA